LPSSHLIFDLPKALAEIFGELQTVMVMGNGKDKMAREKKLKERR
jgi:hypothetical protein